MLTIGLSMLLVFIAARVTLEALEDIVSTTQGVVTLGDDTTIYRV